MKRISGSLGKGMAARKRFWRWLPLTALSLSLLLASFSLSVHAPSALAASSLPLARGITSSPTQGPVGAVITVTGSNLSSSRYPSGAQIDLGYSTDFSNCNAATDSQPGIVKNGAFSGWLRWPASTGTGNFEVCASVRGSNTPFIVGMYQVLAATPPQISLTPTTPGAGKQVTVTGANFLPAGTNVTLVWPAANGLPSISLGTVPSDGTGAFSQSFTVPAHAITGTYSVQAIVGSGQPPTMSASTSFHVNGITIAPVSTPTASPVATETPTVVATAITTSTANGALGTGHPTNVNSAGGGSSMNSTNLLLPIGLAGFVIVLAALVGGVFVVRKQRALALAAPVGGNVAWSGAGGMLDSGGFAPVAMQQVSTQPPPGNSMLGRLTRPHKAITPDASRNQRPIPFDPGLAEAMRQAQVSLFATPRPSPGEEFSS